MTIESNLARITVALETIAAALSAPKASHVTPVAAPTPAVEQSAPVVAPVAVAPVVAPVAAPVVAPAMPAAPFPTVAAPAPAPAPTPVAPVVAPVVVAAPAPVAASPSSPTVFASKQEMTDYVVSSYRALGAEKGAQIQGVLTGMGYANINDVDPSRWGELKAGIEALKG